MKLERGMLLLEPAGERTRASIWAVANPEATQKHPVLVQALPEVLIRKTLNRNALPDGWIVLDNRELAELALGAKAVS